MLTFKNKVFNLVQVAIAVVDEHEESFILRLTKKISNNETFESQVADVIKEVYNSSTQKEEFNKIKRSLLKMIEMTEILSEKECKEDIPFMRKYRKLEREFLV